MRVVFDLDGTLADDEHRQHYLEQTPKDWDRYFALCGDDKPIWPAIGVLKSLHKSGHLIEIWTGRTAGVRIQTRDWLERYRVFGWHGSLFPLLMRPIGDYTQDIELKGRWLNQARKQNRHPDLVFEDRTRVVEFWRSEGVPCFQVAAGDF